MSKNELIAKIETLNEWETLMEEAKTEAEAIRSSIKAEMEERGVEELQAGSYIISFKEFIKTHKSFYIERCKNKNIEFYVDVSRDFDLRLNRGMLNQVFDNLFSNAEYWLDYSAQQGLIENKQYHISAIERGIIVVWDNGIGISPDLETRLFDPFETKKKDGRGLGLYIAAGNLKYTKIARSLSQGFKRKACFELFQLFNSCLCDGVSTASSKVQRIRQKTLNYLFANKASVRGESYIEVAARLVQIFHQDEYNKAIAGQHSLIAEKAHYYEKLCAAITETVGNEQALTSTLKEYRDIELYNKHINAQHCEIATGDIFKIGSSYFLLVSQACDTCLRSDGHRKLEFASLLEIQDNKQTKFSYPLSCFLDMQKPVVMYHALKIIPFDILDLCVFNGSGQASVVLNDIASYDRDLEAYTNNYRIRFGEVLETVKAVQSNRAKLESFLSGGADITAEDAKAAYEYLEGVDSNMKKFDSIEIAISFPVRRIARLNELTTIDIVKEYGIALSRIGHPFDFSGEISAFE